MKLRLVVLALVVSATGSIAPAAEPKAPPPPVVEIRFEQHRFTPETVEVPAGVALTVHVVNTSEERIEFESFKLNREKVVAPGKTLVVRLPALRRGRYDFYDDLHPDVPEGTLVAR